MGVRYTHSRGFLVEGFDDIVYSFASSHTFIHLQSQHGWKRIGRLIFGGKEKTYEPGS